MGGEEEEEGEDTTTIVAALHRRPQPGVFACVSPTQDSVSWPHRELHRMRYSQRRYSQMHMVGSFVRLISSTVWRRLAHPQSNEPSRQSLSLPFPLRGFPPSPSSPHRPPRPWQSGL